MNTKEETWLLNDKYHGVKSDAYLADVEKLKQGEHLAYLIGWVPFLGCHIGLESRPLIPRPETEWWTEQVIRHLRTRKGDILECLDLFSGSGCIGVAILTHEPRSRMVFGDIEASHLTTIKKNIVRNKVALSRTRMVKTDVFSHIHTSFDIITANPPYIDEVKRAHLDRDLGIEPSTALYAPDHGLHYIDTFLAQVQSHLRPGGVAFLEFDTEQVDAITALARTYGVHITFFNDQYGLPRFLMAQ